MAKRFGAGDQAGGGIDERLRADKRLPIDHDEVLNLSSGLPTMEQA
ncbi:hypothetical protein [Pseudomonas cavernae]|nr:hypothetical protein [Pseudomonas cavernae]